MSDLLKRAGWTFVQAFVAVFFVGVPMVVNVLQAQGVPGAKQALISLITASLAAGISALKTFIARTV